MRSLLTTAADHLSALGAATADQMHTAATPRLDLTGWSLSSEGNHDSDRALERHTRPDPERYETRNALAQDHLSGHSARVTNADEPPFKSGTFTDSAADDGAYWNVRKFPEGAAIALSHEHDRDIDVFMDRDTAIAFAHALLWAVDGENP